MKKAVAVMYADGHMADSAWAHRPINGDAEYSLSQIVDMALVLDVPVLGAGDLIDKAKVMSGPVTAMFGQLDRLHEAGLKLYYIRGQHEGESDFLAAHPAAISLNQRGCLVLSTGLRVQGIDYKPAGVLQEKLSSEITLKEVPDILLLHQVWDEFMGSIACPQGSLAQVPLVPLVLTGDYHGEYLDIDITCEDNHRLRVINPGSVCMQSIVEPKNKRFAVLYEDDDENITVESVLLRTRPASTDWNISSNAEMDNFVKNANSILRELNKQAEDLQLPEHLHKPLIRVEYGPLVDEAKKRIQRAIGDRAHLFYKPRPAPRDDSELTLGERQPGESITLESRLPSYLESQDKKHLLERSQRLLQADDPFSELARMQDEYVKQK